MSLHNEPSRKILSRFAATTAALLFSVGAALARPRKAMDGPWRMSHEMKGMDMRDGGMGGMDRRWWYGRHDAADALWR